MNRGPKRDFFCGERFFSNLPVYLTNFYCFVYLLLFSLYFSFPPISLAGCGGVEGVEKRGTEVDGCGGVIIDE